MTERESIYCGVDGLIAHRIVTTKIFDGIATKRYHCKRCNNLIDFCIACNSAIKHVSVAEHLVAVHGSSACIKTNMDDCISYKSIDIAGLEYMMYLKCRARMPKYIIQDYTSYYDKYDIINIAHKKSYFCIFCDGEFDCLPTVDGLLRHLNVCASILNSTE